MFIYDLDRKGTLTSTEKSTVQEHPTNPGNIMIRPRVSNEDIKVRAELFCAIGGANFDHLQH